MTGIEALRAAKKILGTEHALARAVGKSQSYVHEVLADDDRLVPAEWCIPLQDATEAAGEKIPRAAFRPDIYPGELEQRAPQSITSKSRDRKLSRNPGQPRRSNNRAGALA